MRARTREGASETTAGKQRDKAEAMAAYARQAKDSDLIQYATEIKVRAERRCGELLATTVQHGGDRKTESRSNAPTLIDMGLTRDESSRYQQLAAMPAEHFETAVATAKALQRAPLRTMEKGSPRARALPDRS